MPRQQDPPLSAHPGRQVGLRGWLLPGVVAFLVACALALLVARLTARVPNSTEQAVILVGVFFGLLLPIPVIAYAVANRGAVAPERLALVVLLSLTVLLAGVDLYWLGAQVVFPADILVWSESDFVNDILKLRVGYPLYTAQANNDSFVYMPGAQLLTYGIASLFGDPTSVSSLRAIQLGYTVLAAIVGVLCVRRLLRMSDPELEFSTSALWAALWLPALFLLGTNTITDPFIVNLHNDALAQLLSIVAFWLLLEYAATRDRRVLVAMALIPAAGFLVKQTHAVWAVWYLVYLLFFERPRSIGRALGFGVAAFSAIGVMVAACYLAWGDDFIYWTIKVLGAHRVDPLRSIQHVLDAWAYFAAGLGAGLVLLRGPALRALIGPWLVWLATLSLGAYTSGIAWMLNHMGPGSMIAGIWFLAAGTRLSVEQVAAPNAPTMERAFRSALAVGLVALLCAGLGVIRIPMPAFSPDAHRYVAAIEREFEGLPPQNVLLDVGSWVYTKSGVIMKDRAPSVGERGYSETGDFSALLSRVNEQRYAKILVRNFHSTDFWYDHFSWPKSSGIRRALERNYHEVGTIPAVQLRDGEPSRYLFSPISILVRNGR